MPNLIVYAPDDPILAREAELRAAMLTNDVEALDRLLDDELVFAALDGTVVGKQADLEAHRARRLRLARIEPTDVRVVRCGTTVVVSVEVETMREPGTECRSVDAFGTPASGASARAGGGSWPAT